MTSRRRATPWAIRNCRFVQTQTKRRYRQEVKHLQWSVPRNGVRLWSNQYHTKQTKTAHKWQRVLWKPCRMNLSASWSSTRRNCPSPYPKTWKLDIWWMRCQQLLLCKTYSQLNPSTQRQPTRESKTRTNNFPSISKWRITTIRIKKATGAHKSTSKRSIINTDQNLKKCCRSPRKSEMDI